MYLNRFGGVEWTAECDMARNLDCSGQHCQCSMKAHWTAQVMDSDEQQVDMQDEVHMERRVVLAHFLDALLSN